MMSENIAKYLKSSVG